MASEVLTDPTVLLQILQTAKTHPGTATRGGPVTDRSNYTYSSTFLLHSTHYPSSLIALYCTGCTSTVA